MDKLRNRELRLCEAPKQRYDHVSMGRKGSETRLECAKCGTDSVIQIELTLPDGTEVQFHSCHKCENRWWDRDGEHLGLDAVLDLARRPRAS